jgi:hypothetical protein
MDTFYIGNGIANKAVPHRPFVYSCGDGITFALVLGVACPLGTISMDGGSLF